MTALSADFDMMRAAAAATDARNEEIRSLLAAFIGRMRGVPPTVWAGVAVNRFQEAVERWNVESVKLHGALSDIAATIRSNEQVLRDAATDHGRRIGLVGQTTQGGG